MTYVLNPHGKVYESPENVPEKAVMDFSDPGEYLVYVDGQLSAWLRLLSGKIVRSVSTDLIMPPIIKV